VKQTCPDCGCRVYSLGCVNCDEPAYIDEQERLNDIYGSDDPREEPPSVGAVDPVAGS
jgi:hypothetical protein